MAAYDPITDEPPPSRNWDDVSISHNSFRKECHENIHFQAISLNLSEKLYTSLLLISTSVETSALLEQISLDSHEKEPLGNIVLPQQNPEDPLKSHFTKKQEYPVIKLGNGSSSIVIVTCPHNVPAELSFEWANVLLRKIKTEKVLILGSLTYGKCLTLLPEGESMFVLQTNTWKQSSERELGDPSIPFLPSGNVVDGLAAALLTHCQASLIPSQLLVVVQHYNFLHLDVMKSLVKAISLNIGKATANRIILGHSIAERAVADLERRYLIAPTSDLYA